MKRNKLLFAMLMSLSLGLLAIAALPKGGFKLTEAEVVTKTFAKEDITSVTSYSTDREITADSIKYSVSNVMYAQTSKIYHIQFSRAQNGRTAGAIYNKDAYAENITKVKFYESTSSSKTMALTLYAGDTQNPTTGGQSVTAAGEYTITGNHKYISIVCSNSTTSYIDKFEVYYNHEDDPITSLEITANPTKTEYYVGDTFDPAGMEVTAHRESGASSVITDYTIEPSGELSVSDTYVTISAGGQTVNVPITVSEIVYTNYELDFSGAKTEYIVGDELDTTNIVVTGYYADGSKDVTSQATFSPTTLNTLGEQIISVYVNETLVDTYTVNVSAAPAVARYNLVAQADDLVIGKKVLIAGAGANLCVMGNKHGSSDDYFDVIQGANKNSDYSQINGLPEGALELEVAAGSSSGTYAFIGANSKYLAGQTAASNLMTYKNQIDALSSWTVNINNAGEATIQVVSSECSRNIIYLNGTNRFSCYSTSFAQGIKVSLYQYSSGAEKITLNHETAFGPAGDSISLTATPSDGYEVTSYAWETSDDTILDLSATTGQTITVEYLTDGVATVTCTATDGTTIRQATCTITVHNYTYDVLNANDYIITNSSYTDGLSTANVTNHIVDIDLTDGTNAFHFVKANVADNSYYITTGNKYLEKNGTQARLGLFTEPSDYWIVAQPTLGSPIYTLTDNNGNKLQYAASNTGIRWIAVPTVSVSGYDQIGLAVVQTFGSLEVTGTLAKTTYDVSEAFDPTGLTVTAHYTSIDKDVTAGVTWDALVAGQTSVTGRIEIGGVERTVTFNGLTVTNYVVSSISVDSTAAKKTYFVGESTTKDGLVVTATLHDSTEQAADKQETVAAADYTISPSTVQSDTTQITVSYGGKSASYAITAKPVKYDLADSIRAGDHVVFTAFDENLEMSDEEFNVTNFTYKPEGYSEYEVEKVSNGVWAFRNLSNNKYLAANSKALELVDTRTTAASWSVTINRDNDLVLIETQASTSYPYMSYNIDANKIKMAASNYDIDIYKDMTMVFPESISVDSSSTHPTEFHIGDEFSYTGLKIKVNYGGGAFDVISSGFAVTAPDMNTAGTKQVKVSYLGLETSYNVSVTPSEGPKTLVDIEGRNYRTQFSVGEDFVFGGSVYALYSNGDEELLTASHYEITVHGPSGTGYPFTVATEHQQITIALKSDYSKTFQYEVVVSDIELENITVSGQRTSFEVGDTFEFGGTVTAHYDDGSSNTITSGYTLKINTVVVTPGQTVLSEAGTKTVIVTYEGKITSYTITVTEQGGGGGESSSSESGGESSSSSEGGNQGSKNNANLAWIIPVAVIGGSVVLGGIGVGVYFLIKTIKAKKE